MLIAWSKSSWACLSDALCERSGPFIFGSGVVHLFISLGRIFYLNITTKLSDRVFPLFRSMLRDTNAGMKRKGSERPGQWQEEWAPGPRKSLISQKSPN
jgi:hypothetical protein